MRIFSSATKIMTGLAATSLMTLAVSAQAKDTLHNTTWKSFDDKGKPSAIIKVTEEKGALVARIQSLVGYKAGHKCQSCKGKYAQKSLVGVPVFWNLKKSGEAYTGGTIFDPQKGKSYKLKGELVNGGKTLKLRGYVGSPLLGKTRTWQRMK